MIQTRNPRGGGAATCLLGRAHSPALFPVAVQHHRVAKQSAGGALVQQRALGVQVVGVPRRHFQVQQQHHRFPEGDPSGPGSAPRFRSHALLVGNIQHQTATDQSCTGCDGWPRRRAPQEMKCSSVSGTGGRQGRREERQGRGIGGHRRSNRNAQGCLRPWPTPRFCGLGAGCSCDLGGVLGVVPRLTALSPFPQLDPHPHPAAAVGGARGPRLLGLTSWPGSGSPQSMGMAIGFWGLARVARGEHKRGRTFPFESWLGLDA